jgi:hypothetical protein
MGSGLVASPKATRPAKNSSAAALPGNAAPHPMRASAARTAAPRKGRRLKQNWFWSFRLSFRLFGIVERRSTDAGLSPAPYDGYPFSDSEHNQAERAISTGKLNALPRLHTRPINVVVFHGPSGRSGFEAGFPLRCLQRLSIPYIATLHHRWRDDRSTRGTFTPVLSY